MSWREQAAASPPASLKGEKFWAKGVPGFGDPNASVLLVGLAPAANGANRTGRMFTGDRSGDFLFAAMHRAGYANQPTSTDLNDGLVLKDAYVVSAVRCAPPQNKPTPQERNNCLPFLARELDVMKKVKVIIALGAFGHDAVLRTLQARAIDLSVRRPLFGHGAKYQFTFTPKRPMTLLSSFHPSQRNVFTGKLTEQMFDEIFTMAREITSPLQGGAS